MSCYEHLSSAERERIAILLAAGHSKAGIAKTLGRSRSTISRELERNALPGGDYSPVVADGAYIERRRRDAVLESDGRLRQFVIERLSEGWSPEQVAGWLKNGAEPKLRVLATETIYAFVYRASQKAEELWRYLLRRRRTRRPMRARRSRDTIKNRRSIHDRPAEVEDRRQVGHWEADLVICKRARPVLVLHERKTRVTLATRLNGKTAAETIAAMTAVFRRVAPGLRSSVTFNNSLPSGLTRGTPPSPATACSTTCSACRPGSATPTLPGRREASKTPTDDCDDGCPDGSISTPCPKPISRTPLSASTPRRANASASSPLSSASSRNLARTSESASHEHVALRAGIHPAFRPLLRSCSRRTAGRGRTAEGHEQTGHEARGVAD